MKRSIAFLALTIVTTVAQAGDFFFWGANTNTLGQVYFFRSPLQTPGAAAAVFAGTPVKYLRYTNGAIVALTAAQRSAQDAQEAADAAAAAAAAYIAATNAAANQAAINSSNAVLWAEMASDLEQAIAIEKGVAFCTMDQLNLLRAWIVDFKSAVSNSVTLANFQTRVAALPSYTPITTNGLRTAVRSRAQEFQP
jgi:hypothetical protein